MRERDMAIQGVRTLKRAYDAALKIAAQDALHKAELMAEACGLELDRMVSIEEAEDVNAAIVRITYTVK